MAVNKEQELRRQKLLEFLKSEEPVWREEAHPDIAEVGTEEWGRALRNEKSERQKDIERRFSES